MYAEQGMKTNYTVGAIAVRIGVTCKRADYE